jgi:hypothetical protein
MLLRCKIDRLLLPARAIQSSGLLAWDGLESFVLERLEAGYYELVSATRAEEVWLEQNYFRLLRRAPDFRPAILPL